MRERRGVTAAEASPLVEVHITAAELEARVAELARTLSSAYSSRPAPPVLIGVLKGSTLFMADLIRTCSIDVSVDFMSISSYGDGSTQSGVVRIVKDLEQDIVGKDVVIVEDIVDTGLTLTYLRRTLAEREPASLSAITLLNRRARRIVPVEVDHSGFEIPDVYMIGYGLDFRGRYRNTRDIYGVRDLARLANDPRLLDHTIFGDGDGRA
jgi:hypoxanthine phosphoribosyltransferase